MSEAAVDLMQEREPTSREIVFGEIRRLGLEKNVVEIEEQGFSIVENAVPMDQVERMREVILAQVADKTGKKPDLHNWDGGTLREGCYLLYEDPVFEKLAQNEYTVALMRYLLGRSMVLSTIYSHVRAKGDRRSRCTPTSGRCSSRTPSRSPLPTTRWSTTSATSAPSPWSPGATSCCAGRCPKKRATSTRTRTASPSR